MPLKPMPIGIDDFEKMITEGYYYVDKTLLIKELLEKKGEVNLFMRPRRFGKTLNMSMLQYFFEDTGDEAKNQSYAALFRGLKITENGESVLAHQNRYPTISLTFKSAKQPVWEMAYDCLKDAIRSEYKRHRFVLEQLDLEEDRRRFSDILDRKGRDQDYVTAIQFLAECLYQVYGKPVIILIDEYDVPLENAYFSGFYDKMSSMIRSLLESALKTNPHLAFAVITGCLRITKESIFTGLNNLEMISILDASYDEYFGFTQVEVDEILQDYGMISCRDRIREWYDGYLFGKTEVYNPWSVTNYVKALSFDKEALPQPYWGNTSSNQIVRNLVERADISIRHDLEVLTGGGSIELPVHEDITYDSIYDSEHNLWNVLFFTGYLKQVSERMEGRNRMVSLKIPNEEVAYIFENTISAWFRDRMEKDDLTGLWNALKEGDGATMQAELNRLLQESISYMDSKEAFYHGFLLGVLSPMGDCLVKSNREAGNGRLDIIVRSLDIRKTPAVLELKVSDSHRRLEASCDKALEQIQDLHYSDWLEEEGYQAVWEYGIAFFRKQCAVKVRLRKFDDDGKGSLILNRTAGRQGTSG